MRIAVVGCGGVGGYFGGRLAQAGEEVVFIARGDHLRAIQSQGLHVESIEGDFEVYPAVASERSAQVGRVDAVLLCVKAWQVSETAKTLKPLLGKGTIIVPLQNGVEAPSELVKALGQEHVLGGVCRIISFVMAPGRIRHAGIHPYIAFGELDASHSERTERLRAAFSRAQGLTVEIPPDIRVAMWKKFLLIAAWSGLGAVTRAPIGIVCRQTETRQMLESALREIHSVGVAHGIALDSDAVNQTLTFIDSLPPDGTASMQRDIVQGRPSELASQSGAVMRLGRQVGVEVPVHTFIYRSLLLLELRARGELQFSD